MQKETLFTLTKKDFLIEFYRGSGNGGQHRNKTESCCRIRHLESGAEAIGTEHREQSRNRTLAFKRLTQSKKFQTWIKTQVARLTMDQKSIEAEVDRQMRPENLKIEYGNQRTVS